MDINLSGGERGALRPVIARALRLAPSPNLSRRSLLEAVPLIVICLLPVVLYLPFVRAPFERDEGVYATIAQGLLDGRVPYRDLFDNKPPLVYGWYAFSFLLFGESVVAPRIVAAVLLSFTTLSLFSQARMMYPRGVAYAAAGMFAVSTGLPWVALHANTEAYMLLPLVASLLAFTIGMRRDSLPWFLLAGALGGLAMMTKQVAVWNLIALAVVVLGWGWRVNGGGWRSVTPALCLVTGAAAATALVALPFVAAGAVDDLVYANVSYNWLYVGALSFGQRLFQMGAFFLLFFGVAAPLVAGALAGLLLAWRRRSRVTHYLLVLWALASVAGVASGGQFFPHYFMQLLPAMAVLTAVVIYERWRRQGMRLIGRPTLVATALLIAISLTTNAILYFTPEEAEQRVYEPIFHQEQWESASRSLGAYIAQRTSPEDTIFNYGREAQIYFYADRGPAVPYFYDWALWYDKSALSQTMGALRQEKPVYIIDSLLPPIFKDYPQYHPPAFMALLSEDYDYVGRVYFADVYRLKERS